MLKLSLRYWRVHWKKLVKVLFAMILSSAALMIAFLLARSSTEKSVQDVLNVNGKLRYCGTGLNQKSIGHPCE